MARSPHRQRFVLPQRFTHLRTPHLAFRHLVARAKPQNGKVVVVKVTDRGPYRANTIVDLSKAAAEQIDMIRAGVAQVEVTQVLPATTPAKALDNETPAIPQFQLYDPMTGRYYTTVEWVQRENNRKELAQAKAKTQREALMAKQETSLPRAEPSCDSIG